MKITDEGANDKCRACDHLRYQHGKGCGGRGATQVVCLCQGFDGPPLSISMQAEITRLRARLAAQEARAQRVEQAARTLVLAWEAIVLDPDTQEGLLMDLRAALSQHAATGEGT
jgi:hypothetical protein